MSIYNVCVMAFCLGHKDRLKLGNGLLITLRPLITKPSFAVFDHHIRKPRQKSLKTSSDKQDLIRGNFI